MSHAAPVNPTRRILRVLSTVVLLALVCLGLIAIISGAYQVRPVLSGSMTPGLPVGGVVVTQRVPMEQLAVRDVVVFHRPDQPDELVVHRIMTLTRTGGEVVISTQGDANTVPDPWQARLEGDTAYRAVFSLPWLGYAVIWARSPTGRLIVIAAGVALVGFAFARGLSQQRKNRHAALLQAGSVVKGGTSTT